MANKEWDQEKWDKKYNNMDFLEKMQLADRTAEFYGVDGIRNSGRPGEFFEKDARSYHEVVEDINNAMATGPAATYAVMSGNDLPITGDHAGTLGYHQMLASQHEGGGAFNRQRDIVDQVGDAWEDAFENIEFQGPEQEEPEVPDDPVAEEPYVPSPQVQKALDNVEAVHEARRTGNYYSDAIFNPQEQAGKYVLGLQEGMKDSIQTNLRNSIDLVLGKNNPSLEIFKV